MKKTFERVIVFGATSAIAQAVARTLATRGAHLHLVGRDATKLEAVRSDLLARGAAAATVAVADLDDPALHASLVEGAWAALGEPDAALLAQGMLPDQAACEADPALAHAATVANFLAPASLLAELANRFQAQGHGTLVAIGSVAGDRGRKTNYVYGAAKGGLATFLQGLRGRLHAHGVQVLTVKPGFVDTPMTAHLPKGGPLWASAERVGDGIVRAMERGASEVYVPGFWRLILLVLRHLPEAIFIRLKI